MSKQHQFKYASIAIACMAATSISMANEPGYQDRPAAVPPSHPVVHGLSSLITKAQALPMSLMPARLSSVLSVPTSWNASPASKATWEPVAVAEQTQAPPASIEPAPGYSANQSLAQATSVAASAAASTTTGHWQLDVADGSLRKALQRWGTTSGWQVVWELPVDFPVGAQAAFAGTFEEAVVAIAMSMQNSEMPMKAIFYRGNKVLRIVAKGAQ
jgi:hypothetical protein